MEKRFSTGRLVTDRLVIRAIAGGAVTVVACSMLIYGSHCSSERRRVEDAWVKSAIAVARSALANTEDVPVAGGDANIQRLREALVGADEIFDDINKFSEHEIAEKCSAVEKKTGVVRESKKNEAYAILGQLRQLNVEYASKMAGLRTEFKDKFYSIIRPANEAVKRRDSLNQRLIRGKEALSAIVSDSESMSQSDTSKRLLLHLKGLDVDGMRPSDALAKVCKDLENSWKSLAEIDRSADELVDRVEGVKTNARLEIDRMNQNVASANAMYKQVMDMPVGPSEEVLSRYKSECRKIGNNVRNLSKVPYDYDKSTSNWLLNKISELEDKIASGNTTGCDELFRRIQEKYCNFSAACNWRQGVAHPEIAHVISSSNPNHWIAEAGWEFVNPGTSDLSVRRKAPEWAKPKDWYERECNVIEKNVLVYTSGGYRYPRGGDVGVFGKIQNLRQRLIANDPDGSARCYAELKYAYDSFVNQSQWISGMKHPFYPHVVSGTAANQWVAENGWEFVNPGTSDYTVKQKQVKITCPQCHGNGQVVQRVRCQNCGGSRKVANPAAQIGSAIDGITSFINSNKRGRRIPRMPNVPSTITCQACHGTGQQQQSSTCSKCGGSKYIYQNQRKR